MPPTPTLDALLNELAAVAHAHPYKFTLVVILFVLIFVPRSSR